MLQQRRVKLFRNNQAQAVRIPRDWELPGSEAVITKDGERLIIEPGRPLSPGEKAARWSNNANWPLYSGPPIDDSREALYDEVRGL
jgi:virulence-associated protein VagC